MPERLLLPVVLLLLAGGAAWPRRRVPLAGAAAVLLAVAVGLLGLRHVQNDVGTLLVWQHGLAGAPWYGRLAMLWAGDAGTMLVLASLTAAFAPGLARRGPWSGLGALSVATFFTAAAVPLDPFAPTPADAGPARGGVPRLDTLWMALHPPLVLAGFAVLLAPAGSALAALAGRDEGWAETAERHGRAAWLLLGLGLVTGMAWAYEDFTFAPFWHWDPVQAAVFAVWALVTAHLHTLRPYRAGTGFARLHPLLGAGAALAVPVAMAATRHPALASSHRYVGEATLGLLLAGTACLTLAIALAWGLRRSAPPATARPPRALTAAVWGLAGCGLVVLGHLAAATAAAALEMPKTASGKPYYEFLARWAPAEEIAALQAAFARWEPDPVAIDQWLLPLAAALSLLAGHLLLPFARRRHAATLAATAAAGLAAMVGGPAQALYDGTGMTASGTARMLPLLDAFAVALAYAALAGFARAARAVGRSPRGAAIGLAHGGMAVGLACFLAATVLDSYAQAVLHWPDDFGRPVALADGHTVRLGLAGPAGVEVAWSQARAQGSGLALYRDDAGAERGPVRLICEMLDYRYARYAAGDAQRIEPFVHRGLWRDVQVWIGGLRVVDGAPQPGRVALVLKVLPMVSWMWIGFGIALAGGLAARAAGGGRP